MNLYDISLILRDIVYKDWLPVAGTMGEGYYVQWRWMAPDNVSGVRSYQSSRKWYVSPHATKSEVVQTLLKAALTAEEHEAREQFLYRGHDIFAPHLDVDGLAERRLPEDRRKAVAA